MYTEAGTVVTHNAWPAHFRRIHNDVISHWRLWRPWLLVLTSLEASHSFLWTADVRYNQNISLSTIWYVLEIPALSHSLPNFCIWHVLNVEIFSANDSSKFQTTQCFQWKLFTQFLCFISHISSALSDQRARLCSRWGEKRLGEGKRWDGIEGGESGTSLRAVADEPRDALRHG